MTMDPYHGDQGDQGPGVTPPDTPPGVPAGFVVLNSIVKDGVRYDLIIPSSIARVAEAGQEVFAWAQIRAEKAS